MHSESIDGRLRLVTTYHDAGRVLVLSGESDHEAVGLLHRALAEAARDDSTAEALVDLSGVRFADVSLVNVLLRARPRLGDRLCLLDPSPPLVRLFDILGLRDFFAVRDAPARADA